MSTKRRNYTAPEIQYRCIGTVTLRDGSTAQCMHRADRKFVLQMCAQHRRIAQRMEAA